MRVRDYTHAMMKLIESGMHIDDVFAGLKATLTRRQHTSLFPSILRELERQSEKSSHNQMITITLAEEGDTKKFQSEIARVLTSLGAKSHTFHIDPTITGGFIAEGNGKRIDESYKRKLLTLYRSLIN